MVSKWVSAFGRDGRTTFSIPVDVAGSDVAALRSALAACASNDFSPARLWVYESVEAFRDGHGPLEAHTALGTMGDDETSALFVGVARSGHDIVTLGVHDHRTVELDGLTVLPRTALTTRVLDQLDRDRVVLVASPRQTGKTSLATLVCRELTRSSIYHRHGVGVVVARLSMLAVDTIADALEKQCQGTTWPRLEAMAANGRTVFVIVDEAQWLYGQPDFWQRLHDVVTSPASRLRVLLLAAYLDPESVRAAAMPVDRVLGLEAINFISEEVHEYVRERFAGYDHLGDDEYAKNAVNELLLARTGGHVGLCVATVGAMNDVYRSCRLHGSTMPTVQEWLTLLTNGTVNPGTTRWAMEAIALTPSMSVMDTDVSNSS